MTHGVGEQMSQFVIWKEWPGLHEFKLTILNLFRDVADAVCINVCIMCAYVCLACWCVVAQSVIYSAVVRGHLQRIS